MSANIEQIKAMLERTGKTNLLQEQEVDFDKEYLQLQQEQPEVDLEKYISDFFDKKDAENGGRWSEEDIIEAMTQSFQLGLNAKKEK